MKKKLQLSDLKVQSFVTAIESEQAQKIKTGDQSALTLCDPLNTLKHTCRPDLCDTANLPC